MKIRRLSEIGDVMAEMWGVHESKTVGRRWKAVRRGMLNICRIVGDIMWLRFYSLLWENEQNVRRGVSDKRVGSSGRMKK